MLFNLPLAAMRTPVMLVADVSCPRSSCPLPLPTPNHAPTHPFPQTHPTPTQKSSSSSSSLKFILVLFTFINPISIFPRPGWLAAQGRVGVEGHHIAPFTETPELRGMTKRPSAGATPAPTKRAQRGLRQAYNRAVCARERRAQARRAHEGWGREGRKGGGGHHIQKLPRTETPHPNAQSPSQARNIHRVARSPPPRTITLNIHKNAWEGVHGPYRRRAMRDLEGTVGEGGWLALAQSASQPVRG
jgi:hypothetical protein